MSEFFNVTLRNDVIIDDSITSNKTTWTSEKIQKEIIDKRITKFKELQDVDVNNIRNKQVIAYSKDTDKFTGMSLEQFGEATGLGIKQISKMGIVGSEEKPRLINIPINTLDFKVPKVNILKYDEKNTENLITTKNEFTNGEANDFKEDNCVIFDGKAHLKIQYDYNNNYSKDVSNYIEYISDEIDITKFKLINSFQDLDYNMTKKIRINAIPKDRLLIPQGDMNLSNVRKIKSFKLKCNGDNIKIICSVDSGVTWKTFNEARKKWLNVNLKLEDVKKNGMNIELFNSITEVFWNELVTTKKIRFAYLLKMDSIDDVEELDKLDLIYDGEGKWIQVKDNQFDVIYSSNTLLQIYCKFSGDIKINYGY